MQALTHKLYQIGGWFTEDPRRVQMAIITITVIAIVAAFAAGFAPSAVLIGPNSGGGSTGSG
jgi:hypothetical protein